MDGRDDTCTGEDCGLLEDGSCVKTGEYLINFLYKSERIMQQMTVFLSDIFSTFRMHQNNHCV